MWHFRWNAADSGFFERVFLARWNFIAWQSWAAIFGGPGVASDDHLTQGEGGSTNPQLGLRVSAYDKVASLLIALLIVIGFFVILLFIIWLTSRLLFTQRAIPVELVEYSGRGHHAAGFERDLEEPGLEELEEMVEPSLEVTLEAVTDLVSSQAAAFDMIETAAELTGSGTGMGDSRPPGPMGEGSDDVIPPWERWEIRFATTGVDAYARQLDFFEIELGAAGGGVPLVEYASNLSAARPTVRKGRPEDEDRLYMSYRNTDSQLAVFDRQLLTKAGIRVDRRLVLQFYSKELERQLMTLEASTPAARGRKPQEYQKTIFGVQSTRGGFEFVVLDQFFRQPPRL